MPAIFALTETDCEQQGCEQSCRLGSQVALATAKAFLTCLR